MRDPSVEKMVPCEDQPFGRWVSQPKEKGLHKSRLHITIVGDNEYFWISDRRGQVVKMEREELLELVTLLNKRLPLDILGSI